MAVLKSTVVNGDLAVTGTLTANELNMVSDARRKENIEPLVVDKSILDLPLYTFDFIDGPKNQIGCLAQDLQQIAPKLVEEDKEADLLLIRESKIQYLILDELKKLNNKVIALEAEIAELKKE